MCPPDQPGGAAAGDRFPATALSHYLYAGTVFVSRRPCVVTTVLGPCVSVCLWDHQLRLGGSNHFMLPQWTGDEPPSPKFGNIAIAQLLEELLRLRAQRRSLVAKVFGGKVAAEDVPVETDIGRRNALLALQALADAGIPVIAQSLGGPFGRKLLFHTGTGQALVKPLQQARGTQD